NQDYQYEELVDTLRVNRDVSRNPLFDTMLTLQNMEPRELKIPGVTLELYSYKNKTSIFDLRLTCWEAADYISCEFEYCTNLFREETIQRFINYFKRTVHTVLANPAGKIKKIDVLPPEERQQLLYRFNDTVIQYPKDKTIHGLFEEQAMKTPDSIAVLGTGSPGLHSKRAGDKTGDKIGDRQKIEDRQEHISYRHLDEWSHRLAQVLREKGTRTRSNPVVAVMLEPSFGMIAGLLAILKAG
ncbi:MAG: AMP-binding protein, partial [bacterium]|nr:AMP-binding protein [bacterium]